MPKITFFGRGECGKNGKISKDWLISMLLEIFHLDLIALIKQWRIEL